MPAAAVTAAITTGGGLIKGAMGMSAANKAGKLAAAAGQQANQVATDVYNTSKKTLIHTFKLDKMRKVRYLPCLELVEIKRRNKMHLIDTWVQRIISSN